MYLGARIFAKIVQHSVGIGFALHKIGRLFLFRFISLRSIELVDTKWIGLIFMRAFPISWSGLLIDDISPDALLDRDSYIGIH